MGCITSVSGALLKTKLHETQGRNILRLLRSLGPG